MCARHTLPLPQFLFTPGGGLAPERMSGKCVPPGAGWRGAPPLPARARAPPGPWRSAAAPLSSNRAAAATTWLGARIRAGEAQCAAPHATGSMAGGLDPCPHLVRWLMGVSPESTLQGRFTEHSGEVVPRSDRLAWRRSQLRCRMFGRCVSAIARLFCVLGGVPGSKCQR